MPVTGIPRARVLRAANLTADAVNSTAVPLISGWLAYHKKWDTKINRTPYLGSLPLGLGVSCPPGGLHGRPEPPPRPNPPPPLVGLVGVHAGGAVPDVDEAQGVGSRTARGLE